MMWQKIVAALLGLLVVAVAGCGGKSRTASTTTPGRSASVPAVPNVSGVWTGGLETGAPVSMTLKQNGTNVNGDVSVGGRPDISGPIDGRVEGDTIRVPPS